ncbi:alpha-(1-_3)-arabinofuranosyltransferase domain-containing protein [Knoellia sp. Soil729]|uniref:alpha-(1->3)-arabinofuranosyltransferase domain-containing protein n=1 Tax=Knoellia sp. Soil729 TaxID=1736394 RepID=UPI0006FB4428|nr:alpha-(1->3)-arabinofuranosyltransferase family protein [Knoellia sp. Soil729]KRE41314.1 hypothetical protein ASG74_12175 [Knoellia sp. Soil729]
MTSPVRDRSWIQAFAGLLVVWSVAWSVTPGRISEDTKNDLYVDPWGFLGRALHLWDPQVTWGGLQNQAFGYLFPMGPFFGIGSEVLPMWVVQRLWWMALLTAGFAAMMALLRAFGVAGSGVRVIASLAYVLAPRVISTIGGLSSEAQPQLLAPAILLPLVLVERGRVGARKGAALSGVALLCCGGVNATATAFAVLPAAIWLVTRRSWWRRPVTWVWGACVLAATSWWLVPLVVMGRYSPPFLEWIENAQTVTAQITLLDVFRGTTHWLGHLVTSGGVWWPAGFELVSSRASIVATTCVMALGLAGFLVRGLPHRAFLLTCLALGVLFISLPHQGPFDSPLAHPVQQALDGPLAPLRNVHKADLLIRLPLAVGLAHLLRRLAVWRPRRAWLGGAALTAATLTVIGAAAPGFSGAIAPRGSFVEVAEPWRDLGRWLDGRTDGQALIVPASSFGEYLWGRPMDEPLRALTSTPYAVRDAVPLAPAGTVRLLDEVETRLQTGRPLGGADSMLRAAGVRYLVVRNDLAAWEAGQPPVAIGRSAVVNTAGASFVKGFGKTWVDSSGERVFPLEVYALKGHVATDLEMWAADDLVGASGASEDLARLADAGMGGRPVIFDGDRTLNLEPGSDVVTDGFRARDRWFGAPRGQDVTNTLDEHDALTSADYLPWPGVEHRSVVTYTGIRDVRASSSIAQDFGVAGLQPAHRAFAALDGNPRTSWAAAFDDDPTLTIELEKPTELRRMSVQAYVDRVRFGKGLGIPTELTVSTDAGSLDVRLSTTERPTTIELPAGLTSQVTIHIRRTTAGKPATVVTGLAEVRLPGISPVEAVRTPSTVSGSAQTAVLGAGLPGTDGCALFARHFTCYSGLLVDPESTGAMVRTIEGLATGDRVITGTLAVDPLAVPQELLTVPGVEVTTSSLRGYAPSALPQSIIDSDPRTAWSPAPDDSSPSVTIRLDQPTAIQGLRLQTRGDWAKKEAPAVVVDIDGSELTRRLPEHGVLSLPPRTGRHISITFVSVPGRGRPGVGALELEELEIVGHPFAPPVDTVSSGCGEGPRVTVDGQFVPTAAEGRRDALFGIGAFTWRTCEPVRVAAASSHTLTVDSWRGLAPRSAVLAPERDATAAHSQVVSHRRPTPTRLTADLSSGALRVLVMGENANPGWQATLGGSRLAAQVVDGRRQGFVVPTGAAGRLTIEFAPDRAYRWGLGAGSVMAALVVLLAVWPDRATRRRVARGAKRYGAVPVLTATATATATVVWCALIAGPAGVAVGVAMVIVSHLGRHRRLWLVSSVLSLTLAAAVIQSWVAPGRVGSSAVEASVRLLVLAALAIALATQEAPDER